MIVVTIGSAVASSATVPVVAILGVTMMLAATLTKASIRRGESGRGADWTTTFG